MKSSPWVSNDAAQRALVWLHYASPIILLFFFLAAFMLYSIRAAPPQVKTNEPVLKGPGGKPLPRDKRGKSQEAYQPPEFSPARRHLFRVISVGATLTFVANATAIILHTLVDRANGWWCGQHAAVSTRAPRPPH